MIIRAIDPGSIQSAYVDWDGEKIHGFGIMPNEELSVAPLAGSLFRTMVVEMVASYGMPVGKDVFETCVWIGQFLAYFGERGWRCNRVYRKDVKMHLCGNCQAKDSNIITAIVDRFDPDREYGNYGKGKKDNQGMFYGFSNDVWQAFAVALTFYDQRVKS